MDQKLAFSEILSSTIGDAEPSNPIFFILSPGSYPVKEVEILGKLNDKIAGKSFFNISLG